MFIQQDILQLQVPMDTILRVDISHSAHQLRKYLFTLFSCQPAMLQKVVVQLIARTILQHQPHQRLRHNHFIQTRNMGMHELSMMVDFAGKVGVVLKGRFEYHFGVVGEFVRAEIDFAEGTFAD
jgi:hypothetical protein